MSLLFLFYVNMLFSYFSMISLLTTF